MLWPIVNAVTIVARRQIEPPSSSSPSKNRRWSGPIMMCSIPDLTNVETTAQRPSALPLYQVSWWLRASRIACCASRRSSYTLTKV